MKKVFMVSEQGIDVTENQGRYPWESNGRTLCLCDTLEIALTYVNEYIPKQIKSAREDVDDVEHVNVYVESFDEKMVGTWVTYMDVTDTSEPHHKCEFSLLIKEWPVIE